MSGATSGGTAALTRLFSVEGKVALVTGGSRGIGLMMARGLVEQGARVYISSRSAEQCAAAAAELAYLGTCIPLSFDLSTMAGITGLVAAFGAREDRLNVLVNNAGASWSAPLEEYPEEEWDKVMNLNVKAPFFLVQKLLDTLKAGAQVGDAARIINIASVNGLVNSRANNFAYSSSKAAITHLTRHLSTKLAPDGINVNAIAPGYFVTDMTAHLPMERMTGSNPLGRTGCADDIVGAVIYLASHASAWMTGVILPVDGGLVAAA